jgi:hypothetical protein
VVQRPDRDELVRRLTDGYAEALPAGWTLQPGGVAEVHVPTGAGGVRGDLFLYGPAPLFDGATGLDPRVLLRAGTAYVFAALFPPGSAGQLGPTVGAYAAHAETVATPTTDVVFGATPAVPEDVLTGFVAAIAGQEG